MRKHFLSKLAAVAGLTGLVWIGVSQRDLFLPDGEPYLPDSRHSSRPNLKPDLDRPSAALKANILNVPTNQSEHATLRFEDIRLGGSSDRLMEFEMGDYDEFVSPSGKIKVTVFGANSTTPPGTPDLPVFNYMIDGVDGRVPKVVVLDSDHEVRSVNELELSSSSFTERTS